MTPPDTPEAVERLANELDDMNKDETWVRYPTTLGRRVPAALRAYAQLLRQVEQVRAIAEPEDDVPALRFVRAILDGKDSLGTAS